VNPLGQEPSFWFAVAGATVVKLMTSPYHSILRAASTVFAAIFAAYFFTDALLSVMDWDPDRYKAAVAALLALTGEGLMRVAIQIANDPTRLVDFVKAWRGGK
tara:strand:- start:1181 stop:1489 length:309 start_codon:yes stop_codon:yes gene_type:complete